MTEAPKQMHLLQMLIHSACTHSLMSWTDPVDGQIDGLRDFGYWQDIARTLERGCFDAAFFADSPAAHSVYQGSVDACVRYGVSWPNHDPMPLVAVMAAATTKLGIGVTLSTTGTSPYLAMRRMSTLNYLSRGRVGWNIVTGFSRGEHMANGTAGLFSHDERYDYADEYMDICYRLWGSVPPNAVKIDKAAGLFADPSLVKPVDVDGRFLNCQAIGPVLPEAHGRPVLMQAGSSGRGMRFAVTNADIVFAIQAHVTGMNKTTAAINAAAREAGVARDPIVIYGVQPILGGTEAEAKARARTMEERIPLDAILARLSGVIGHDLSSYNPDDALVDMDTQASRGLLAATASSDTGKAITLREAAQRWALTVTMPQLIGTPEQVAEGMIAIWRETGCAGFNLSPTTNPDSVHDFVDQVVPILQREGVFRREYAGSTLRDHFNLEPSA